MGERRINRIDLAGEIITPPAIREIKTENIITAPILWGKLFEKHRVIAATVAHYPFQPHGSSERYWDGFYPVIHIENDLQEGRSPRVCFEPVEELFALGSLVGISESFNTNAEKCAYWSLWKDDPEVLPRHIRAFVTLDLETKASRQTLDTLVFILSWQRVPWYLLESGDSYHLILDKLVEPQELPHYWGALINCFTCVTPRMGTYYGFGDQMRAASEDTVALRRLSSEILENFGHIDGTDKTKLTHFVDIRWVAHNLEELCDYLEGKSAKGVGFLRVSRSNKYALPPALVAEKSDAG